MQLKSKILRINVANLVLSHDKKTPFVDRLNETRNMRSVNETRNMLSISTRRQSRRESKSFRRTVRIAFTVEFSITVYQCCGSGYSILWFYDPLKPGSGKIQICYPE